MSTPTPPYGGSPEDRPQDQQPWQPPGYSQLGGYGQPYPQQPYAPQGYGQPGPPKGYVYGYDGSYLRLADWGERVGALLIDSLVSTAPVLVGYGVLFVDIILKADDPDAVPSVFSIVMAILGLLAGFGLALWNRVFRQGRTGQSIGKSALKIKLIDVATHQPIGATGASCGTS